MNRAQRDKALALDRCRFYPGSWERRVVHDLALLASRVPDTPLTPKQRWLLDFLCYRFRRQLLTMEGLRFEIPMTVPEKSAYGVREDEPLQAQLDMDGSRPPAHSNPMPRTLASRAAHPQRGLL